MNYKNDTVLTKASGLWAEILQRKQINIFFLLLMLPVSEICSEFEPKLKERMFGGELRVWKFWRNNCNSFFCNLTNDKFCLYGSSTSGHQINCHRHIVRDIYSLTSSFLILWEQFCEHSKNMLASRHIHRVLLFDEHQLDHGDEPYTYTNLTYAFFWSKCSWWICTGL